MNLVTIRSRVLIRSDENPAVTYTAADTDAAINEGLQLFGLLTLCVERTVSFATLDGIGLYRMLLTYADWIVPLRIKQGGVKVRPVRLADLAALDGSWRLFSDNGIVSRYAHLGFDLLALYGLPADALLQITYAAAPAALVLNTDIPEIPDEYHPLLASFAIYRLRFDTGGQDFQAGLAMFKEFLEGAVKLAAFVRTRSLGLRFDAVPYEIAKGDLSRLVTIRKDLLPFKKEAA